MTEALGWPHVRDLLEPGEIHLGQNLLNVVPKGDSRYASFTLKPVDQLAAFHPKLAIGKSATIEIAELASYPLLLLDGNLCSANIRRRMPTGPHSDERKVRKWHAAYTNGDGRGWSWRRHHSLGCSGKGLQAADCQRLLSKRTAAGANAHSPALTGEAFLFRNFPAERVFMHCALSHNLVRTSRP